MEIAKRIYCIEGHHDWGDEAIEPTVEPMLQLLRSTGYWQDYVHRKCVTVDECQFYLEREWAERCKDGSILYFATHGGPGEIWLSGAPGERWCQVVTLDTLSAWEINCANSLVHFGGCCVFAKNGDKDGEAKVREFMIATGAPYASGYATNVNWLDITAPPSVALELMYFSSIHAMNVRLGYGGHAKRMRNLAERLQSQFETCELRLIDRWGIPRQS